MNTETQPQRAYSASEQGFQRLLIREQKDQSQPGDGLKRAGLNLSILVGATVADLGESHIVDKIWRVPQKKKAENAAEAYHAHLHMGDDLEAFRATRTDLKEADEATLKGAFANMGKKLKENAMTKKGVHLAGEFVEEWASDSLYAGVANTWVRLMTGVDGAKYVTETSAFISDWANVISQVFGGDKLFGRTTMQGMKIVPERWKDIKLAYQSMDFVNPVNVEAAFRVIEEVPVVGDGVAWLHEKADKLLENKLAQVGNTAASKGILGFHIGKNVMQL